MEKGLTVFSFLSNLNSDDSVVTDDLRALICGICDHVRSHMWSLVKNIKSKCVKSSNEFGDKQLNIDLKLENELVCLIRSFKCVKAIASEENPALQLVSPSGKYIVCWDPLDGSSIVGSGFTVGTIIGIWVVNDSDTTKLQDLLIGRTGKDMVASIIFEYGPMLTCVMAVDGSAYHCVCRDENFQVESVLNMKENRGILAPANIKCSNELKWYKNFLYSNEVSNLKLKYSGGLVPDVVTILLSGGIFINPTVSRCPAKLRVIFECFPIAYAVEASGGCSVDEFGNSFLDTEIKSMHDKSSLICGSRSIVEKLLRFMK